MNYLNMKKRTSPDQHSALEMFSLWILIAVTLQRKKIIADISNQRNISLHKVCEMSLAFTIPQLKLLNRELKFTKTLTKAMKTRLRQICLKLSSISMMCF